MIIINFRTITALIDVLSKLPPIFCSADCLASRANVLLRHYLQCIFCIDGRPCAARLAGRSVYWYPIQHFQSSHENSGVATLSTSAAVLLFNLSKPSMSYWPLEFPAIWLSVLGVDLVFSAGTLFIATFALPHEQSMAGALFNTMIQVRLFFFCLLSKVIKNIDNFFFPPHKAWRFIWDHSDNNCIW